MRPRLDTTACILLDLADQPASQYVLVVDGSPGGRQAFAVDHWLVQNGIVAGYLNGVDSLPIVAFPERYCWQVLNRVVVEPIPFRQYASCTWEDDKLTVELRKKVTDEPLSPDAPIVPGATVSGGLMGHYL